MSININHALYTIAMILLAFITAIVVTKTISKYFIKKEEDECDES